MTRWTALIAAAALSCPGLAAAQVPAPAANIGGGFDDDDGQTGGPPAVYDEGGRQQGDYYLNDDYYLTDDRYYGGRVADMYRQRRFGRNLSQQPRRQALSRTDRPTQTMRGRVIGMRSFAPAYGGPATVRLAIRTPDGSVRTVNLGDVGYVGRSMPRIRKDETITVAGERVTQNGRTFFHARDIQSRQGRYSVPDYRYNQTLEGQLTGLRRTQVQNGLPDALVAEMQTRDGRKVNVLIGSSSDLRGRGVSIQPGDQVRVKGYRRSVRGGTSFVVQDVTIAGQSVRPSGRDRLQRRRSPSSPGR